MTQPVQEPTNQRSISGLKWRTNQLERRPAPPSTNVIPVFHAEQSSSSLQTIADSATTIVKFNSWNNGDPTVFDVGVTGGLLDTIILLQPGVYSCTLSFEWLVNFNATMFLAMLSDYDFAQVAGFPGSAGGWVGSPAATFELTYPAPFEPTPGSMGIVWTVRQHSGVGRDTDFGTFVQCRYHGPSLEEANS